VVRESSEHVVPASHLGVYTREGEEHPRAKLRTVQEVVERAVREVVREVVLLQGSSRTDSGVHAKGQVAAFTCSGEASALKPNDEPIAEPAEQPTGESTTEHAVPVAAGAPPLSPMPRGGGWPAERGVERLVRAINGRLPEDVLVVDARVVGLDFDPVRDAVAKAYTYRLYQAAPPYFARALWERRLVHHVHDVLDVEAMRIAAQSLVGEHDFVSFAALHHGRLTTVRRIFSCEVRVREPISPGNAGSPGDVGLGKTVEIEVTGSGFLYNMVRIIAGTLVEVGRGRMRADAIPAILAAKDRRAAGPTLPATGLCLEWIRHDTKNAEHTE
jgi:tRNA pseudouridine38-40 synthase